MAYEEPQVAVISCSGEEIAEGTISRLATRRVLEMLRPNQTVTICLPLFLAGNEEERSFAYDHPTITVDGCDKRCAQFGTEKHSGPVAAALVVSEILKGRYAKGACSCRQLGEADQEAIWVTAEHIAAAVDQVLQEAGDRGPGKSGGASCSCSRPMPAGTVTIEGQEVVITGLQMVFRDLASRGVAPEPGNAGVILDSVAIYHPIPKTQRDAYQQALLAAYQQFAAEEAEA